MLKLALLATIAVYQIKKWMLTRLYMVHKYEYLEDPAQGN